LWDYADVCCEYAHYERHENVLRIPNPRFLEQNSLKRSTANIFQPKMGNVFILHFGSKSAKQWALQQVRSALLPANGGEQNGR
jgi:hypothetical protein